MSKKSPRAAKAQSRPVYLDEKSALEAQSPKSATVSPANAAGPGIVALLEDAEETLYQARAVIKMTTQALEGAEGCEYEYTALELVFERLGTGLDAIDRAVGRARTLKMAAEEAQ